MESYRMLIMEALPGNTPREKYETLLAMIAKVEKWDELDKNLKNHNPHVDKDTARLKEMGETAAIAFGYR